MQLMGTEPQLKSNLVRFSIKILHLFCGNNFSDFSGNQLTSFRVVYTVNAK